MGKVTYEYPIKDICGKIGKNATMGFAHNRVAAMQPIANNAIFFINQSIRSYLSVRRLRLHKS